MRETNTPNCLLQYADEVYFSCEGHLPLLLGRNLDTMTHMENNISRDCLLRFGLVSTPYELPLVLRHPVRHSKQDIASDTWLLLIQGLRLGQQALSSLR